MLQKSFLLLLYSIIFGGSCLQVAAQEITDTTITDTTHRIDMPTAPEDTLFIRASAAAADTTGKNLLALDTATRKFNPRLATFRSLIIPGWGQFYNKKYWKIPIVYGALGTTAGVFLFNVKTYRLLRKAVLLLSDTIPSNDSQIDPRFVNLSLEGIRSNRNVFRQNIDYSVLFFLVFWGLNVVDATVDAHLKAFDVSSDITFSVQPSLSGYANSPGLSLIVKFKDSKSRIFSPLP